MTGCSHQLPVPCSQNVLYILNKTAYSVTCHQYRTAIGFLMIFHLATVFFPPIHRKDGNTAPPVTCYHLNVDATESRLTLNKSSRRSITDHLSFFPLSNKYCKHNETILKHLPAYNVLTSQGQYIISCDIYGT